ncbi:S-adenosyl-L-methionine-dependent methyltransferase [Trema orientale]|uniref:S-adenosyl-L-methionine-dependent methyltransferase n=1 Tax=Trema orientale TaxID=63057 RepID=A0A2P5G0Z6_TREOI|nr:S-adenosyl-L-methionine-dependent methyltransferase [Trema orientale]
MAMMGFEEEEGEKWVKHYSSNHQILVVGDGDFSFSLSLARSFGSASNILPTSLDPFDVVTKKYKKAKSNLENLRKLGTTPLHDVNATLMKIYSVFSMRKFDRIIFNFPHAGFCGKEDDIRVIHKHRSLVHGFFWNARSMLRPDGEIHVNHKTTPPFCLWNIEELATWNSLVLIKCVDFNIRDYPGYNNKRGDGARCDQPFPLGKCSTFKFRLSNSSNNIRGATSRFGPMLRRFKKLPVQNPSTSLEFGTTQMAPVTMFTHNSNQPLQKLTHPPGHNRESNLDFDCVVFPLETSVSRREVYLETFPQQFGYKEEILGRTHHGMVSPANEIRPGRPWNHDMRILPESSRRTCYDVGSPVNDMRFSFNRETTNMLPGRTSNHDSQMLPQSGPRSYYEVRPPAINELRYGFNRDMTTRQTLNHDMHMLHEFDQRTCNEEGFSVNELRYRTAMYPGRTLDHEKHMLLEFDQRTRLDASFPVNELRFDINRDSSAMLPGRILYHDMHKLPGRDRSEIQRLVREYGN